jgi:glutamine synthetase
MVEGSAYEMKVELPQGLPEALSALRGDDKLRDVLGERFIDVYAAIKDLEHQEFMTVISPWEREHLLLHV